MGALVPVSIDAPTETLWRGCPRYTEINIFLSATPLVFVHVVEENQKKRFYWLFHVVILAFT